MSGSRCLISVVMPVWNGAAYLREAVESVLRQDADTEVIVVDDGSTDDSLDVVADLACRTVSIPHSGIARACNTGIAHAAGDYLLVLDQDDVLCADSLRTLYGAFERDASLQAVASKARDFISPELGAKASRSLRPRPAPYHGLMGATLLRRDVFNLVGGFNETYLAGQAVDFLLRLATSGVRVGKLDFVSTLRRLHKANTGRTMKDKQFSDYGAILRAKLRQGAKHG